MSPKDYLISCMASIPIEIEEVTTNEKSSNSREFPSLDNQEEDKFEDANDKNDISTIPSGSGGLTSVPERPKIGKICKSTWQGLKCKIENCTNVHIDPCTDHECLALDGRLPLYKTRNCHKWHDRPKPRNKPRTPRTSGNGTSQSTLRKPARKWNGKFHQEQRKAPMWQYVKPHGQSKKPAKQWTPPLKTSPKNLPLIPSPESYAKVASKGLSGHPPAPPMPQNLWLQSSNLDISGSAQAATANVPLNRGGDSYPWGQNPNQIQIQLISEICQQVMKNLMTQPAQMCPNYQ